MSYNSPRKNMKSRWSVRYKKSINCNSPKGFSQKNYCKRKKRGGKYLENTNFKNWLLLNENIESNFDDWAKAIIKYEKPSEVTILRSLGIYVAEYPKDYSLSLGNDINGKPILAEPVGSVVFAFNTRYKKYKDIIIKVLKNKKLENLNWLSFSIGYLAAKMFLEEDLELAIDVTKKRIDNGDLPKSDIGKKGWMVIGNEASEHVREYIRKQQELSSRQKIKLKKSGETLDEDEELVKLIGDENNLKLYFLPKLDIDSKSVEASFNDINDSKYKIEARKRILCKYGKGTHWCTAIPSGEYDQYYVNDDIYIVHENDAPKYQFVGCNSTGRAALQFMDTEDNFVHDIEFEIKKFLNEYAFEASKCYKFKIFFSDIKSYLDAPKEFKEQINKFSLLAMIEDKNFKNLSENDLRLLFSKTDIISDSTSLVLRNFLQKLPDNYIDFFSDKKIILIIKRVQWMEGYKLLDEKLSNDRLESVFNNKTVVQSKGITIKYLLEDSHNLHISYSLLDFLLKKTTINKDDAYIILDTMINKIIKDNKAGFIHEDKTNEELNNFAKIFKKENINKIDIKEVEHRLKVKLIKDGKLKKYNLAELKGDVYMYLMIKFLAKHHDELKSLEL